MPKVRLCFYDMQIKFVSECSCTCGKSNFVCNYNENVFNRMREIMKLIPVTKHSKKKDKLKKEYKRHFLYLEHVMKDGEQ